jgi:tetratricopeptide (TPR) repeat protein
MILNNQGILYTNLGKIDLAYKNYNEAVIIYRKLVLSGYKTDLSSLASTLNNFGIVFNCKKEVDQEVQCYIEALEIYQRLAVDTPQAYLPNVAITLINLSVFYQDSVPVKELSMQYLEEALEILTSFREIPYVQNYLQRAFQTLQAWGINPDEYWQQKIAVLPS